MGAARDLFMARDYEDVSTEEVLSRSGVSRGALYHHFPTKLELFKAVWEASERGAIERVASGVPEGLSPFDVLIELARGYLSAAETDEEMRRIGLRQSRAVLGWEAWREEAMRLGLGVALAAVSAAIEAEELPAHDPEAMATVLLGATIEAAMVIATAEDSAAARGRAEPVVIDMLRGLHR